MAPDTYSDRALDRNERPGGFHESLRPHLGFLLVAQGTLKQVPEVSAGEGVYPRRFLAPVLVFVLFLPGLFLEGWLAVLFSARRQWLACHFSFHVVN